MGLVSKILSWWESLIIFFDLFSGKTILFPLAKTCLFLSGYCPEIEMFSSSLHSFSSQQTPSLHPVIEFNARMLDDNTDGSIIEKGKFFFRQKSEIRVRHSG